MNEITLKIPYDIKVSSIDSLSLHDNATLEVKITFKKIVELNCKDCILLDIHSMYLIFLLDYQYPTHNLFDILVQQNYLLKQGHLLKNPLII